MHEEGLVDVIIGEVKQGPARFNPSLLQPEVLRSVLRSVIWLYDEPIGSVVDSLRVHGVHYSQARAGGRIRTRIVAFGEADRSNLSVISLSHVVTTVLRFFEDHD